LLALLLRTGIVGKSVLQMAHELLQFRAQGEGPSGFGGIAGLLGATGQDLRNVKGLGPAKCAEITAVLELARRAMAQQLSERTLFADPGAVKHYLQLHLAQRTQEVFAVLFLDVQNRLLTMKEMFFATLTQLSVTLLRKYFGWLRQFSATQSESRCRDSGYWRRAGYG
jgi:DNA repair protein RadC